MDSLVQLALMTKASSVFAKTGQFLCFPALSPYSFKPEQLAFARKLETADDWRAYSEFSRAVNHVVRGPLHDPTDPVFLWDIVDDVLARGECAGWRRAPTPEDEAAYRSALALLFADPDGASRKPSDAAVLYGRYRDAVLVAEEDYRNRQLSAENGGDPDTLARWRDIEAPLARRQIDELNADWESKGQKNAIEAARRCVQAHDAEACAAVWQTWRSNLNPDLDMPTDLLLNRFAGTSFTPADLAGDGDWPRLTLERAEIAALAAQADPVLRQALGGDSQVTDIDRVTFEYRSAGLDRPWLPKDLFSARFWRLPPGEEPLSDGGTPPQGRLPAYAVGVVFARNIEVVRRPAAGDRNWRVLNFAAQNLFTLATAQPLAARTVAPEALPARVAFAKPMVRRLASFASAAVVRDHRRHPITVATPTGETAPPPPPPPPVSTVTDPNIAILAMICRAVERAPNPDPSLPWPPTA
jgi:hypothetical protein